jgi:hypothetical protein
MKKQISKLGFVGGLAAMVAAVAVAGPASAEGRAPTHLVPATHDDALMRAVRTEQLGVRPEGGFQTDAAFVASTPSQDYRARFAADGVHLRDAGGDWSLAIRFVGHGCGRRLIPAAPAKLDARGQSLFYRRGDVTEWYVNTPDGVQQWFQIESRPFVLGGELRVEMEVDGLRPVAERSGKSVRLVDANGELDLVYTGLKAWDAAGRELDARMETRGERIALLVKDAGAVYPVRIDPFFQQTKLVAGDARASDQFGFSVSVDGDTAAVGAPFDDDAATDAGSVYVFVRSGGAWSFQQKLTNPSQNTSDQFGYDVDVLGDTIVVGEPNDDQQTTDAGRVYVYNRSGGSWTTIQSISNPFGQPFSNFGWSVSIDGNDMIVGIPFLNFNRGDDGGFSIFRRSAPGNTYSNQSNVGSPFFETSGWFGWDVAINATQQVALVGSPRTNRQTSVGGNFSVWTNSSYTSFNQENFPQNAQSGSQFGYSLAMTSGSGTITVAVGQPFWDASFGDQGRVEMWTGTTTFARQQVIENPDPDSSDQFGFSVSVAGDFVAIGAPLDDNARGIDAGAVHIWSRVSGAWNQDEKIIAGDGAASDQFGAAVAIAGGATPTVVAGAPSDDIGFTDQGSAYAYLFNAPPVLTNPGPRNATEDVLLQFTCEVTDEGGPLTFELRGTPPQGASINASTGVFTWTPNETQGGQQFNVTIRVTDNGGLFDEETFTVTVAEDNKAPTLGAIGNRSATESVPLTFTATATDADLPAQTLTFSLVGAPQGASINASTGAFTWTPSETQGGQAFTFAVRVTDNGDPARSGEETITVTVAEDNKAPVFGPIPDQTAIDQSTLRIDLAATDPDDPAQQITFSVVEGPDGAQIVQGNRFVFTPTEEQSPGVYNVTLRATDNGDPVRSTTASFVINVVEVNQLQVDLNGRYFAAATPVRASTANIDSTVEQVDEPAGAAEGTFTPFSDGQKKPRGLVADLRGQTFEYDVQLGPNWTSGDQLRIVAGAPNTGVVHTITRGPNGFAFNAGGDSVQDDTGATLFRIRSTIAQNGNATTIAARLNGSSPGTLIQLGTANGRTVNAAPFTVELTGATNSRADAVISRFTTSWEPENALFVYAPEPYAKAGESVRYELGASGLAQAVIGYQAFLNANGQSFVAGEYSNEIFPFFFQPIEGTFPILAAGVPANAPPTTAEGKCATFDLTNASAAIKTVGFDDSQFPTIFTDNQGIGINPTLIASNVVLYESTLPTVRNIRAIGQRTGGQNLVEGGSVDTGLLTITVEAVDEGSVASGLRSAPTITLQFSSGAPVALTVSHVSGNDFRGSFLIDKTIPNGPGTVTIVAVDDAGNTRTTTANFTVSQAQTIVSISVQGLGGNVVRAIGFTVGGEGGSSEAIVVPPTNVNFVNGQATVILDQTDGLRRGDAYSRIGADDRLHTLRRTVDLTAGPDPDQFAATIQLKSGDATNDNVIDVLDYGVVAGLFGQNVGQNTPANFNGNRHPDFDGNGIVQTQDALFVIAANQFLEVGDDAPGGFGRPERPRKRATVAEMQSVGVRQAPLMDLDRDGWISVEEITGWLNGKGVLVQPN